MNGSRSRRPDCSADCLENLDVPRPPVSPWGTPRGDPCYRASFNGHLDCLRFAHERGSYWDEWCCSEASYHGHLSCLRYAHENGCPWDKMSCLLASKFNRLDCLAYALENGCPTDFDEWDWEEYNGDSTSFGVWYHCGVLAPVSSDTWNGFVAEHRRDHIRRARILLRCAVTLLGLHRRACERVYAPGGVGYLMAETSFHSLVSKDASPVSGLCPSGLPHDHRRMILTAPSSALQPPPPTSPPAPVPTGEGDSRPTLPEDPLPSAVS